jgi:adenylate cyclase
METDDAGLHLARDIRQKMKNPYVRIILRTGQPGQAPEEKVIMDYDINDYRTKTELTQERLLTTLTTALRAYRDIVTIDDQRRKLKALLDATQRFVPFEFLKLLEKSSIDELSFGDCIQTDMSVLFCDIRSFTTLSENMTPDENFRFLNSYLNQMSPIIAEHHGFIDKYIGDAIMALFVRAADDALHSAVVMLRQLKEYNQGRKRAGYPPIEIGIGINTGALMLGMIGTQNRMEGTVISDAVNLASRIESLTKYYGTTLLISEHTHARLTDPAAFHIRLIDRVKVKGRNSRLVDVFEVFNEDEPETLERKLANSGDFEQALSLYQQNQLDEARSLFEQCLNRCPGDPIARIYVNRCDRPMD